MSENQMRRLLSLVAKHLGGQWIDLSDWLRSLPENELAAIEQRVTAGQWAEVVHGMDDAALRFAAETQGQYVRAGDTASKWLDRLPELDDKLVHFDMDNARVVARARQNKLDLVHGFRDEQNKIAQQVTRRAIIEGAQDGINPRRVAQDFRDSIGLAPNQEVWVANYRRDLEQGRYGAAMRRQLHDARTNRMLRNADELTPAQVDKLVEGYRKRMVGYRAETIARTASSENVHDAVREAFTQAISRGDIEVTPLLKEWHARRRGPRAREQHQEMNGVEIHFDEDFVLPDGTRMSGPGDARGGAEHNASCGCTLSHSLAA